MKVNPVKTIIVVAILTCTIPAYLVRIFEIPFFRVNGSGSTFDSYFNSLYFTIITFQTVGYGDIVPGTIPGKIVILCLSFWGAFITSQIVLTLTYAFSLSQSQNQVLHQINLTRSAAAAIKTGLMLFKAKKELNSMIRQEILSK